jgi:hypothetical protein
MRNQPYSYWLVKIFLFRFSSYAYETEMLCVLENEAENINARTAAAITLWEHVDSPTIHSDYDAICHFIALCAQILEQAERFARTTLPTELGRIIRDAHSTALELEREAMESEQEARWMKRQYQESAFFSYR